MTHASLTYAPGENLVTKSCEGGHVYGSERLAGRTALGQPSPNPFNPQTSIAFAWAADGHVGLTVYDVRGRLVRTLMDGATSDAGRHDVVWNGRDEAGLGLKALASGLAALLVDREWSKGAAHA